jgi:hypothetical protein
VAALVVTLAAVYLPDQGRANVTTDAVEIRLTMMSFMRNKAHGSEP